MKILDLRFVEWEGKKILQMQVEAYAGSQWEWVDVPFVDL